MVSAIFRNISTFLKKESKTFLACQNLSKTQCTRFQKWCSASSFSEGSKFVAWHFIMFHPLFGDLNRNHRHSIYQVIAFASTTSGIAAFMVKVPAHLTSLFRVWCLGESARAQSVTGNGAKTLVKHWRHGHRSGSPRRDFPNSPNSPRDISACSTYFFVNLNRNHCLSIYQVITFATTTSGIEPFMVKVPAHLTPLFRLRGFKESNHEQSVTGNVGKTWPSDFHDLWCKVIHANLI